jgi:hypothetical protein
MKQQDTLHRAAEIEYFPKKHSVHLLQFSKPSFKTPTRSTSFFDI